MHVILIGALCALGLLIALSCCAAAGRADDNAEAWERQHNTR